ncbi:unnamed protein product [Arctia plantaginis]|uniref:Uncharacterized protein n=1 Tax=Arctia plantaginis TaxID=874455 RepID=A0A8S1ACT3_ARCPL|nr:unnamed protein product [Arctia plantaginis]
MSSDVSRRLAMARAGLLWHAPACYGTRRLAMARAGLLWHAPAIANSHYHTPASRPCAPPRFNILIPFTPKMGKAWIEILLKEFNSSWAHQRLASSV